MRFAATIILIFGFSFCRSQELQIVQKWPLPDRYKMIGINTTPLLTQLIPFNRSNPLITGPYSVEFHRFNGSRSFHTSLGFFFENDSNFEPVDNANFNFRIGGERRVDFGDRWYYLAGWDVYLSAGSFNLIGQSSNDAAVLGLGPRWAIGFRLSEPVSISIETAMVVGLDLNEGSLEFLFIPPVALSLNFNLPRKK